MSVLLERAVEGVPRSYSHAVTSCFPPLLPSSTYYLLSLDLPPANHRNENSHAPLSASAPNPPSYCSPDRIEMDTNQYAPFLALPGGLGEMIGEGLTSGRGYHGTVFRMSLRTKPGDISGSKCTVDAVEREVGGGWR